MTCIKHESEFAGLKNKKGWTPAEKGERGDNKAWTILYSPNTSSHYFNMGGFRAFESVVQQASIHTRASFLIAWWQGGRLMMHCWGPVSAVGPLGFAMYWTSGWGSVDAAAATSAAVVQPAAAIGLTRIGCWWGEPHSLLEWSDLGGAKNKFCIYSWDMQASQDLKKIKIHLTHLLYAVHPQFLNGQSASSCCFRWQRPRHPQLWSTRWGQSHIGQSMSGNAALSHTAAPPIPSYSSHACVRIRYC